MKKKSRLGRRLAGAFGVLALGVASAPRVAAAPAPLQGEFTSVVSDSPRPANGAEKIPGGGAQAVTASLLLRRAWPRPGWYLGGGMQAENFFFASAARGPRRLQDYAAVVSLEYYAGDENVAALTLRPGWYFSGRATAASWDVPIDFTTGVPMTHDVSGVLGFGNARFYHHALPVIGVVWTPGPRVRLEAVYPEPALVLTLARTVMLRLGGELTGGGFLADTPGGRTAVEYASYRVGAELSGPWRPGVKLTLGAGIETERSFDFFRRTERRHGGGAAYVKFGAAFSR